MGEINIKDLIEYFISKISIVIVVTITVILAGAVYSLFFQRPAYESTTRLVLTGTAEANSNKENDVEAITQNDLNLNSKLVSTYREIIKSKTVLKDVINTLDLDYSVNELMNKIKVSTVSNTEMICITVTSNEADETAKIANELANVFSEHIKGIYNIENISIIDKAEIPNGPVNVNIIKQIIIYGLIGLVLAIAIVFAVFYFDNTLKDASQIEKIGLTVLTSVPQKQEEGGKKK